MKKQTTFTNNKSTATATTAITRWLKGVEATKQALYGIPTTTVQSKQEIRNRRKQVKKKEVDN